ncbi:WAT1-related protein At3g28050-like isoform X2 [Amaranthus tricolor]|uniref:WAT1-related protein At3g28050-like isoform X2 n=1 Tax=Amaranthus tricolor TaxID=29722 RepID=UPI00258A7DC7|nr:WAT1-related protein At3g28050-like isoform X2 [Amaranthus tricolor]
MWEIQLGLILLMMELMDVSNNTLGKAAMAKGLSNYIFTTYTHGIAVFFLIPLAYLYHRNTPLSQPIGVSVMFRLFLLGVLCCGCSIFLYLGIRYSSPTLASAMNNLSPAFTFIMGIIFRMEILNLKSQSSVLKALGTIISIAGAFIVTLYQGMPIIIFSPSHNPSSLNSLLGDDNETQPNWVLGGFLLFISSLFLSFMYVAKALDVGMVNVVQTWACGKKGPLFVAMFKPLQMIIAAILGVSFLGDVLHLGSVIGGTVIAFGFYTVMKGKADEESSKVIIDETTLNCSSVENTSPHKVPLLLNKNNIHV